MEVVGKEAEYFTFESARIRRECREHTLAELFLGLGLEIECHRHQIKRIATGIFEVAVLLILMR